MAEAASGEFRHPMPPELQAVLDANKALKSKWDGLTELGRNEWICWLISPKTLETRAKHLERLKEEVVSGKRRPCCWPGCQHRKDRPANTSSLAQSTLADLSD